LFYFLVLLGSALVGLGLYNKNDREKEENPGIERRLEAIESILFEKMVFEGEKTMEKNFAETEPKQYPEQEEVIEAKKTVPDNIRIILEYQNQGLNVTEIAKKTGMKKGEVLLLKDLSKNYLQ